MSSNISDKSNDMVNLELIITTLTVASVLVGMTFLGLIYRKMRKNKDNIHKKFLNELVQMKNI